MTEEFTVEFNEKTAILEVRIGNYNDIVKDGKLEDEFLNSLFEGYQEVENSEKKKSQRNLSLRKRFREAIRKNKQWSELPIKEIHLYPSTISDIKSKDVREAVIESVSLGLNTREL